MKSSAMEIRAKRTCYASAYVFAASGPQGWADLPDDLLESIAALLSSFHDLLAFGATCRPWRYLFSAHTSSFQPLLLHPTVSTDTKQPLSHDNWTLFSECEWRLADPASDPATASFRSLLSSSELRSMTFLRYSYGHLIFCGNKRFCLVNAFNGTKIVPPCIKTAHKSSFMPRMSYFALSAPVASTDSHFLVGGGPYLFQWRTGDDSWTEHLLNDCLLSPHLVAFKGKTYALGSFERFTIIHLSPSLIIQKFKVMFDGEQPGQLLWTDYRTWLVVCGDTILLVKLVETPSGTHSKTFQFMAFKLESLDAMNKKAWWVKVERLDNWAIFVSADWRCQALSCMNPERWGGRSNHVYFPSYQSGEPWAAVQLWHNCNDRPTCLQLSKIGNRYSKLESTWVFPGTFPSSG